MDGGYPNTSLNEFKYKSPKRIYTEILQDSRDLTKIHSNLPMSEIFRLLCLSKVPLTYV